MSILTAPQKAAIAAKAPIRQLFKLYLPGSSGGAATNAVTIHDDATTTNRVTNAGRRTVEAYNVSMRSPGRLGIASYTIEVDNSDAKFSPYATDTFWDDGGYLADPKECLLKHQVYVLVAGAWSEITGVAYIGRITDVRYDAAKGTAEITSDAMVKSLLDNAWTVDDGDTFDTGLDINV